MPQLDSLYAWSTAVTMLVNGTVSATCCLCRRIFFLPTLETMVMSKLRARFKSCPVHILFLSQYVTRVSSCPRNVAWLLLASETVMLVERRARFFDGFFSVLFLLVRDPHLCFLAACRAMLLDLQVCRYPAFEAEVSANPKLSMFILQGMVSPCLSRPGTVRQLQN